LDYWCVLLTQLQEGFLLLYDIFGVKMSPTSRRTQRQVSRVKLSGVNSVA